MVGEDVGKAGKATTLGSLAFTGIWLAGWSVGVAVIQGISLATEWDSIVSADGVGSLVVWLFVFTHGGSEVAVIWATTKELINTSRQPREYQVNRTMDETVLQWHLGHSTYPTAVLSIVIACIIYVILFIPIIGAFALQAEIGPMIVASCFGGVWIVTMYRWFLAYRAQIEGLTQVTVRISNHQLTIHEDRPGPDRAPLSFFPSRATIHFNKDRVSIIQDDQLWERQIPSHASNDLEEVRQLLLQARQDQSDTMEIPKALSELVEGSQRDESA